MPIPKQHPCLRIWGKCASKNCAFANAPYDLCIHFAKGQCSFGDHCQQLHDSTYSWKEKPTACKFYMQGMCTKGLKCTFSHSEPKGKDTGPATLEPKLATQKQVACKFYLQGLCTKGLQCKFAHPDPDAKDVIRPAASQERAAKRFLFCYLSAASLITICLLAGRLSLSLSLPPHPYLSLSVVTLHICLRC